MEAELHLVGKEGKYYIKQEDKIIATVDDQKVAILMMQSYNAMLQTFGEDMEAALEKNVLRRTFDVFHMITNPGPKSADLHAIITRGIFVFRDLPNFNPTS